MLKMERKACHPFCKGHPGDCEVNVLAVELMKLSKADLVFPQNPGF